MWVESEEYIFDWAPKAASRKEQQKQCIQIVGYGKLSVARDRKDMERGKQSQRG